MGTTLPVTRRDGRGSRAFASAVHFLRYPLILGWVAVAAASILYLPSISEVEEGGLANLIPQDARSVQTELTSAELFDFPLLSRISVVQRNPSGLTPEAQTRAVLRATAALDRNDPQAPSLLGALPVINVLGLFPGSREVSTTAVTFLFFQPDLGLVQMVEEVGRWAQAHINRPEDGLIGVTGPAAGRAAQTRIIANRLPLVEAATVLLIFLIVGLTFRSPVAALATLATAAISFLVSVRAVAWLGQYLGLAVPGDLEPVMVVLLLGIVTDYSVFFLSGLHVRVAAGRPRGEAARGATAEVFPIILTAGLIVAVGSAALLVARLDFLRVFGPALSLTVLTSLAVTITFLPALMGILGAGMFWPRRPTVTAGPEPVPVEEIGVSAWRLRLARFTTNRAVAIAIAAVAIAALAVPTLKLADMRLGFRLIEVLPDSEEADRAQLAAATGFSPGIISPTLLLLEDPGLGEKEEALIGLETAIREEPGVAGVVGPAEVRAFTELVGEPDGQTAAGDSGAQQPGSGQPLPGPDLRGIAIGREGGAARYAIIWDASPYGADAIEHLRRLDARMPQLLRQSGLEGVRASFAGDTALARETIDLTSSDLRRVAVVALLLDLLLLVLFLRALVAPLYLLLSTVLALGAALGITTWVVQGLLGHPDITYYVPFAAAVLLLSLGSDYNVFVVGRIWSEARHRPLREAVATATPRAARTITVAAIALAGSFALLALVPLTQFLEFAFLISVGVLLDSFVVRSMLVPSLVTLFGTTSGWPGGRLRSESRPRLVAGQAHPPGAP
jgi:putative drug exporter of the RND superfamily